MIGGGRRAAALKPPFIKERAGGQDDDGGHGRNAKPKAETKSVVAWEVAEEALENDEGEYRTERSGEAPKANEEPDMRARERAVRSSHDWRGA